MAYTRCCYCRRDGTVWQGWCYDCLHVIEACLEADAFLTLLLDHMPIADEHVQACLARLRGLHAERVRRRRGRPIGAARLRAYIDALEAALAARDRLDRGVT